ncbi:barstar family protein [Paratissierella segnis]|mgnify:CR=1 FL=1|jgi:ribonuclease inhibitor|uniref:Barstar family protein n=1 Tax=Paratissierella segnis TaxID=2763679 RepID=A0A926IJU2_9FIRM|nr:barstar family protein [Paratissierella segnis]MBC8587023.1 barstar family protein [Paratissierella segnis]
MNLILLNGKRMTNKVKAHRYLKRKLKFPDYYGENLDALWDELSTIAEPTDIKFINKDILIENLGTYGEEIIRTFVDAAEENKNIGFEVI